MQTLHEYPLTPSEIIFLGEKASSGPSESLVGRMLAAAFIANDMVGAIRLEVHSRKAIFGLKTITELLVVPRTGAIEWPSTSLEANVVEIAEKLSDRRKNSVSNIVYEWMGSNAYEPWVWASKVVKEQLVTRGLLEKNEERRFRIFKSYRFSTPRATLDLVSQAPVSLVSRMFSDFRRTRHDLSQRLLKEATKGVQRRKQSGNYDYSY